MKKLLFVALLAGVLAIQSPAFALKVTYSEIQPQEMATYKGGPMAKADYALTRAHDEFKFHHRYRPEQPFQSRNPLIRSAEGRVLVEAVASTDPVGLLTELRGLGLTKSSRYGSRISGWLPFGLLPKALSLDKLQSISASLSPITHTGQVSSEGDIAMRSDVARLNYGIDGSGTKVGVLSDSYDALHDAAKDQANDDLPPAEQVTVLADYASGSDEGRAMMQIIHDVAPGAALSFHTAFNGMADFAGGIIELAQNGAETIVDDVLYFAEPMFQDGIVAQAVDQVVNDHGVAYFSAAGNQARDSYESGYVASGERLEIINFWGNVEDRGTMHDFDPGPNVDYQQGITIPDQGQLIVALQWDTPFGNAANDVDIYLVDDEMVIWAESISDNISGGDPVEVLQFTNNLGGVFGSNTSQFHLIIAHFAGPEAGLMKYVLFKSSGVAVQEYRTASATLYGHANAAGAEAVGAAFYQQTPAYGQSPPLLEYFSSAGGTPILFDPAGGATYDLRSKPEIVGPDGGNTTFFYADTSRDPDSWPNFFGTSAAAPHAAAVAALLRSHNPALLPAEIYAALETSAIDMNAPGFDHDSGHGFIQADQALAGLGEPPPPPPNEPIPPVPHFSYSCLSKVCTFDGTASTDDSGIVSYAWTFGDGLTETGSVVQHPYVTVGSYAVSLTVVDIEGESAMATAPVTVKKKGTSSGSSDATGEQPVNDFCARNPNHPKCR